MFKTVSFFVYEENLFVKHLIFRFFFILKLPSKLLIPSQSNISLFRISMWLELPKIKTNSIKLLPIKLNSNNIKIPINWYKLNNAKTSFSI